MKNVLNKLLFAISMILLFGFVNVNAMKLGTKKDLLELYQIKSKEDVLVEDIKILDFYQENSTNLIVEEIKDEEIEMVKEDLSLQQEIVNFAIQFVGNPYVSGGTSLTNGADCSGFVQTIYATYGIYLPRTTYEQSISGVSVALEDIRVGDIVSYGYEGYSTHSALYIGDGMIVHSSTPELGIRIDSLYIMPIVAIRRII